MATQRQRVASWYWIVSAILTPFLLLACIGWAYFANQSQSVKAEAARISARIDNDADAFKTTEAHIKDLAAVTGFDIGDPAKFVTAPHPRAALPTGVADQDAKPNDQNAVYGLARSAEKKFYGEESTAGHVHRYLAAQAYLDAFQKALQRYLAYKAAQYYTVRTIDIGGTTAAVAAGEIKRDVVPGRLGFYYAPADALANAPPLDTKAAEKILQPPTRISMELILRKQAQLIDDLAAANQHQYSLLYAEVAGIVGNESDGIAVGYMGEEKRLEQFAARLKALGADVSARTGISTSRLDDALAKANTALDDSANKTRTYSEQVTASSSRITTLADAFERERVAHEADATEFQKITRNLPRLNSPQRLEKRQPDAEITFSEYSRRVVHIDLGRADGVRAGQRFEVWRLSGRDPDRAIGVIEIVRTLNDHFSLCTVLSLVDESDPVRKSDKAVSRLWHNGKFLSIALHGTFEPPAQAYSRERLAALLTQAGCRVVDKVQPGTDLVITGSNLLADDWHRQAKNDIRFDTLLEEDVRIYIDPR